MVNAAKVIVTVGEKVSSTMEYNAPASYFRILLFQVSILTKNCIVSFGVTVPLIGRKRSRYSMRNANELTQ